MKILTAVCQSNARRLTVSSCSTNEYQPVTAAGKASYPQLWQYLPV